MPASLTPNEVDALMDAIDDGRIDTAAEAEPVDQKAETRIKAFDLTSRDRIIRGRMPTLDVINARTARALANTLSDMLQEDVDVSCEPATPIKLGEFLSYQSEPACINLISLAPLLGSGLLCVQPDLFFVLLDTVFGGSEPGERSPVGLTNGRDYTSIELDFARNLVTNWAACARNAWAGVRPFEPGYLHTEISPGHVSIGSISDVVISTTYLVRLTNFEGKIELAIPYTSLDPIKHLLLEHRTEESAADRRHWQDRLFDALSEVPLKLRIEFGRASMLLAKLIDLKPGDLVRLNSHPDGRLPMHIESRPKAWVTPVEINGNLAFEFDEWRNHDR